MTNDLRAGSWNDLSDWLFEEAWQADLGRIRSPWGWGRVQDDARFISPTGLQRMGPKSGYVALHFATRAVRDRLGQISVIGRDLLLGLDGLSAWLSDD